MAKILFRSPFFIICVTALLLITNTKLFASNKSSGFVVAKVNNVIITRSNLEDRLRFFTLSSNLKINSPREKNILLNKIIDKMVEEEIVLQEAKTLKIEVSQSEIDNAIKEVAQQNGKTLEAFKRSLEVSGLSVINYEKQITYELLWTKIISQNLRSKINITNAEIAEVLEQNNIKSSVIKYHISEIFIPKNKNNSLKLANKVRGELKKGANFRELVKQFSSNAASADGDLGWVDKSSINKETYTAIVKLEKNGYSMPVLLADGYHIFKVLDKKILENSSQDDLQTARSIIFSKKLQILAKSYLMDLRKKYFIESFYY